MYKFIKEGNILFNNALNTLFTVIWRWTFGKGPLGERGNPLPPLHALLANTAFVTALAGMRNGSIGPP